MSTCLGSTTNSFLPASQWPVQYIEFEMPLKMALLDCFAGVHGGIRSNIGTSLAASNADFTVARVISAGLASRITLANEYTDSHALVAWAVIVSSCRLAFLAGLKSLMITSKIGHAS